MEEKSKLSLKNKIVSLLNLTISQLRDLLERTEKHATKYLETFPLLVNSTEDVIEILEYSHSEDKYVLSKSIEFTDGIESIYPITKSGNKIYVQGYNSYWIVDVSELGRNPRLQPRKILLSSI